MIMIRLHRSRGQMDHDHVENLSLQACWHVEAIADSGLRIIFLTMLLAQNQTTIGIHRSHCAQKMDQNTRCRITGFTILLTSVTSVGI